MPPPLPEPDPLAGDRGRPPSGEDAAAAPAAPLDPVEEASEDSFPASDSPGWAPPLHFGAVDPNADGDPGPQHGGA
jgi:hypothetical protein